MLNKSHSITKILSTIFVFLLVCSSLPINAQPKNSIEDIKKVQKNIREKDPQKTVSQELAQKSKDTVISKQNNLEIEIDKVTKKVRINNQNKGNITIGIPNVDQLNDGINVDNQVVFGSKNNKFDVFVEAVDGGMRQVINIKDSTAPTIYDFPVELSEGENIVLNEDGSASIIGQDSKKDKELKAEINQKNPEFKLKSGKTKIAIAKPWAKDADNKELSTSYSIVNGNILRQTIDTKNAVFPVVADPMYCGDGVSYITWEWRPGWSDSVRPTWCGRYSTHDFWNLWQETVDKTPPATIWDKQYGTSKYWSMYDQLLCHWMDWRAYGFKSEWNLEPLRPNVGLQATRNATCNPGSPY